MVSVSKHLTGTTPAASWLHGRAGTASPPTPCGLCTRGKGRCRSHNNNSLTRSPTSISWGWGTRGGEVSPSQPCCPHTGSHTCGRCPQEGRSSPRHLSFGRCNLWVKLRCQNRGLTTDLCVCLRQTSSHNQAGQEKSANLSYSQPSAAIPCHGR